MIVTPRPVTVADLGIIPGPPRSTDHLHVSALIKALLIALEPERFGGELDYTRVEIGFAVEHMIEEAWRARRVEVLRPGEFEKDGIVGSPDGISFDEGGPVVEEIKCTWMSMRDCPEGKKFWHWIVQIKAYCHLLDTLRGRLHVFFVNGDYRENRNPQYCAWDLQFHQGEIEENWMMLLNQARKLRGQ